MQQFLFLLIGAELKPGDTSPETVAYAERWNKWIAQLAQGGALQSGAPLVWGGKDVSRENVSDLRLEPFDLGGYLLVQAESMEEATRIAQQAPNVALGGRIVVRQCLELPPA